MKRVSPRQVGVPLLLALSLTLLQACGSGGTNDGPPRIGAIDDIRTTLGEPVAVRFTVVTDEDAVTVTARSSDQAVLPDDGLLVVPIEGDEHGIVLVPSSSATGTAVVTVTAEDAGGRSATRTFTLTVDRPFAGDPRYATPQGGDVVGMSVALDGALLVAGGNEYAYVFELEDGEWGPVQKLTSAINGLSVVAGFGRSVAVHGETVVVGAPDTFLTVDEQGVAFVFERGAGQFQFTGELSDLTPDAQAHLGRAVAVTDGFAFAGAPGAYVESERRGALLVFSPDGFGGWQVFGEESAPGPEHSDLFGEALDVGGDTLVVGDYGDDVAGEDAGAAHVFVLREGYWQHDARLAPADLEAQDQFGGAVAADGDWVLVGAWNDDDAAEEAGAVYVYQHVGDGWTLDDKLFASDAAAFDGFGGSLALDYPYAAVGAYLADDPVDGAGAVYVFRHDGETWHEVAKLTSPQPSEDSGFGWAVDLSDGRLAVTQLGSPTFTAVFDRW